VIGFQCISFTNREISIFKVPLTNANIYSALSFTTLRAYSGSAVKVEYQTGDKQARTKDNRYIRTHKRRASTGSDRDIFQSNRS